jgi:HlyD family secretion protein
VLKEGDPLYYLAPLGSPMEAEVRIEARDVGFVRPGDAVKLKLDAFNFVEHGTAEGELRWISEGSFTTTDDGQPAEPYYKARVKLSEVNLRNVPDSFRLIPGMTLAGDVHIGTRSLLMYAVNGALRGMGEAMREP